MLLRRKVNALFALGFLFLALQGAGAANSSDDLCHYLLLKAPKYETLENQPAFQDENTVPVVLVGKPRSKSTVRYFNEQEREYFKIHVKKGLKSR